MATKWEYRSVQFDFNAFFSGAGSFDNQMFNDHSNKLGRDGWELVSTFDTNHRDGDTRYVIAIFKRPLDA